MTVDDVKGWVLGVRDKAKAGDDESAHGSEDALRETVLEAIANGADNPAELAREALKTSQFDFARWCA